MESDLSFPQFLCRPFLSLVNAVISLQWPSWDLGEFKRKRWKADVHGGTMSCSPVIPDITRHKHLTQESTTSDPVNLSERQAQRTSELTAFARTGSGKTAAYVLPMLSENLVELP